MGVVVFILRNPNGLLIYGWGAKTPPSILKSTLDYILQEMAISYIVYLCVKSTAGAGGAGESTGSRLRIHP